MTTITTTNKDKDHNKSLGNTSMNKNETSFDNTTATETYLHPTTTGKASTRTASANTTTTVAVCCGCRRPKAEKKTKKYRKEPSVNGWRRVFNLRQRRQRRYRDADIGKDSEWTAFHHHHHNESISSKNDINDNNEDEDDDESMFFFDAVDHPLGDDEYPIDGYAIGGIGAKVVFTTSIEHPAPRVSMEKPASMLRRPSGSSSSKPSSRANSEGGADDDNAVAIIEPQIDHDRKTKITNHKEPSLRFHKIRKRSSQEIEAELKKSRINDPSLQHSALEDAIGMAGYPGTLTVEELEECVSRIYCFIALRCIVCTALHCIAL